jgi:hypothetical protein
MSVAPASVSNPMFLLPLHTERQPAIHVGEKIKSPLNARHDRHGITNHRRINEKYTANHLNDSSDQLYMQRTSKQTQARDGKEGGCRRRC